MPLHLTKRMKRLSLLLLVAMVNFSVVRAAQNPAFDVTQLSPKGRIAYSKLVSEGVFSVGGVGYGGTTSEGELALYDLLEEKDSVESLKSLVRDASFEGGLYGLLGLSITNVAEFNRAVDVYKSREDSPPRESKEPFSGLKVSGNEVVTQFGCVISTADRAKLVGSIQAGRFDKMLRPRKARRAKLAFECVDASSVQIVDRVSLSGIDPAKLAGARKVGVDLGGCAFLSVRMN